VIDEWRAFTAQHQEQLAAYEAAIAPLRAEHYAEIVAAEQRYADVVNAPLDWSGSKVTRGWNTDYWTRVGPQMEGMLLSWREKDAYKQMQVETEEIDARYAARMTELERTFFPETPSCEQ